MNDFVNDFETGVPPRFLIVSGKVVLAEDLAEMLETEFGATVDVFRTLDEGAWAPHYGAAFLGVPLPEMIQHDRVRDLLKREVPVVVVDGDLPSTYETAGLLNLDPPFRKADVTAILRKSRVIGPF